MDSLMLIGAALVLVSILLTPISARVGAPLLLLFLGLGMLVGEDGPGRVRFDDFELAYDVGSIALAIILFSGGLHTSIDEVCKAAGPAFLLATLGVLLSCVGLGVAVAWLFDFSLVHGLLLGAVVGSTDAAATFLLLQQRGVKLKGRVGESILVESGLNDPMAIFLTTMFVVVVDNGVALNWDTVLGLLPEFGLQLGVGALTGIMGGWLIAQSINGVSLATGLNPPLALAGASVVFAGTQLIGGSGYLAVYLCGIVITARTHRRTERIQHFHEALAWLSQILMFLMLGLLVTPHKLGDTAWIALGIAALLMLVARPLAVFVCLLPFRFDFREQVYISWVGLRGAVPIFLAIIPVISPGPVDVKFFNIVFVIVIISLLLQGWTIPVVAKWLGLVADEASTGVEAASASEHR